MVSACMFSCIRAAYTCPIYLLPHSPLPILSKKSQERTISHFAARLFPPPPFLSRKLNSVDLTLKENQLQPDEVFLVSNSVCRIVLPLKKQVHSLGVPAVGGLDLLCGTSPSAATPAFLESMISPQ